MTEFSSLLRTLRQRRKIRQKELALKTGLDAGYISSLECGHRPVPAVETVARIADGLLLNAKERSELFECARLFGRKRQIPLNISTEDLQVIDLLLEQLGRLGQLNGKQRVLITKALKVCEPTQQ